MFSRIYIDNYRCFSDFEFVPGRVNLVLGNNGSGKSTFFDAVEGVVDLVVNGVEIGSVFGGETLTRWDRRSYQRFEIDCTNGQGTYRYSLEVTDSPASGDVTILRELVTLDGKPLFSYEDGIVNLHERSTSFPLRGNRSFLSQLGLAGAEPSDIHPLLGHFRRTWTLGLDPQNVPPSSRAEDDSLARDGTNFVSWFWHREAEWRTRLPEVYNRLRDVIPGFEQLKLKKSGPGGRNRELVAGMKTSGGSDYEVWFSELSDGQRALVILYVLLVDLESNPRTLLLDEPENFVALGEIQPWLVSLDDVLSPADQLFVVSHNPEVINYLAPEQPFLFERREGGPVSVRPAVFDREIGLTAAEQVTQGLLDDDE